MKDKTFIIAEAGINHMGNFDKSKDLILAARDSGADAVKWQTYKTDLRVKKDNPAYNILKDCEQPHKDQAKLKDYADKIGIEFFSTPFDESSAKFLVEDLGCKRVKIASFDVSNTAFLRSINQLSETSGLHHVIMSVGMLDRVQLYHAANALKSAKAFSVLHCVSAYPTPLEEVNLSAIGNLKNLCGSFCVESFGYSDHTSDVIAPAASVLAGAQIVEKHFTLDLQNGAPDNAVSADPAMFEKMVGIIRQNECMMGTGELGFKDIEKSSLIFKRTSE